MGRRHFTNKDALARVGHLEKDWTFAEAMSNAVSGRFRKMVQNAVDRKDNEHLEVVIIS